MYSLASVGELAVNRRLSTRCAAATLSRKLLNVHRPAGSIPVLRCLVTCDTTALAKRSEPVLVITLALELIALLLKAVQPLVQVALSYALICGPPPSLAAAAASAAALLVAAASGQ